VSINSLSQLFGFHEPFECRPDPALLNNSKIAATADKFTAPDINDPRIPVVVSLKGKPTGMSAGEYILRQALEKIAPRVGLDSSDVEAEIQARKDAVNWSYTTNHDNVSDLKLKEEINTSGSEIVIGVRTSTIERMLKRDAVGKWLAEKKALGITLTDEDYRWLAEEGFGLKELEQFAISPKYQAYETQFRQTMETKSRQTMLDAEIAYLKDNLNEVFPESQYGQTVGMKNIDTQICIEAERRVQAKLNGSGLSALEYVKQEAYSKLTSMS
jgi:hypothetical protein